ncbi:hypothetical protein W823_23550 [Williamsia sp. D3]|nr:hypothetical protein W823_23550 [Williamsia sp. D3]
MSEQTHQTRLCGAHHSSSDLKTTYGHTALVETPVRDQDDVSRSQHAVYVRFDNKVWAHTPTRNCGPALTDDFKVILAAQALSNLDEQFGIAIRLILSEDPNYATVILTAAQSPNGVRSWICWMFEKVCRMPSKTKD